MSDLNVWVTQRTALTPAILFGWNQCEEEEGGGTVSIKGLEVRTRAKNVNSACLFTADN